MASARRSASARLYSLVPRESACPWILILMVFQRFSHCRFFCRLARLVSSISTESNAKKTSARCFSALSCSIVFLPKISSSVSVAGVSAGGGGVGGGLSGRVGVVAGAGAVAGGGTGFFLAHADKPTASATATTTTKLRLTLIDCSPDLCRARRGARGVISDPPPQIVAKIEWSLQQNVRSGTLNGHASRGHRARGARSFLVPRLPQIRYAAVAARLRGAQRSSDPRLRLRHRTQSDAAAPVRPRRRHRPHVFRPPLRRVQRRPLGRAGIRNRPALPRSFVRRRHLVRRRLRSPRRCGSGGDGGDV